MTSELDDEVEALNSIYGDGTLEAAEEARAYILRLPGGSHSSLRLNFPETYPEAPPEVVGTFSSGDASRDVTTHELETFRQAVGEAFQPGMVCLYDAIEELNRQLEMEAPPSAATSAYQRDEDENGAGEEGTAAPLSFSEHEPPPPWVLSNAVTELKSTFVARVAPVTSPTQAGDFVRHLLASDRRVRQASHNMTAWRIRGPGGTSFQDCDDDGETAAGSRLLHLMTVMDLWDAMVVVTRWYGGQKLGPRRFAVINNVARDGFVKAGLAKAHEDKKKGR